MQASSLLLQRVLQVLLNIDLLEILVLLLSLRFAANTTCLAVYGFVNLQVAVR